MATNPAANLPALAADFNAISPPPATLYAAVDPAAAPAAPLLALADTQTVDVPVQSVAAYLGMQGKLASFLTWAQTPPAGASAASQTAASELAYAFEHPTLLPTFYMTDSTVYSQMDAWLTDLVDPGTGIAGPIVAADQTAILALASVSVPKYSPAPQVAQLQAAQRAGLIAADIKAY